MSRAACCERVSRMRYTTASSRVTLHTHHGFATGRSISRHHVSSAPTIGAWRTSCPSASYVGRSTSATVASWSQRVCESTTSPSRRMMRTCRSRGRWSPRCNARIRSWSWRTRSFIGHLLRGATMHATRSQMLDVDSRGLTAHLLERERLTAADTVMIGDRAADVLAARANGVRAIGVLWGYGSKPELRAAGAEVLCAEPRALAGCLTA